MAEEVAFLQPESAISGRALTAAFRAIYAARRHLQGKEATVYIDNIDSLSDIARGDSAAIPASWIVATLWRLKASHDIAIVFDMGGNRPGHRRPPARNRTPPRPALGAAPFRRLQDAVDFYNQLIEPRATMAAQSVTDGGPYSAPVY